MLARYIVKKINLKGIENLDDYCRAVREANVHYCNGIKELQEYCGGALHRQRNGYSGIKGNIEYVAEKI